MNGFWQTVFGGLVVAAFSGLAITAYKYPLGYRRMYMPLVCAVWGAWSVWLVYQFGVTAGSGQAVLETLQLNPTLLIKTPLSSSTPWWYYFVAPAAYAYLSLLRFLPELLSPSEPGTGVK